MVLEAEVQLLPQPKSLLSGVVFFRSEEAALDAVDAWREIPQLRMLEFFDPPSLDLLRGPYPEIPAAARAALLVEQIADGLEEDAEEAWLERMERFGALDDSWFGTTDGERERFRVFRHKLPEVVNERIKRNGFQKMGTDAAVPLEKNREMMRWYRQVLDEQFPDKAVMYGHIGDSHMHVNVMPETEDDARRGRAFQYESARQAVALGGTVSAEHGLGKKEGALPGGRIHTGRDPGDVRREAAFRSAVAAGTGQSAAAAGLETDTRGAVPFCPSGVSQARADNADRASDNADRALTRVLTRQA